MISKENVFLEALHLVHDTSQQTHEIQNETKLWI